MLKELSNSIKAILYDRAVSPLSGVLIVVWCAFNWKALAVFVFGESDVISRISYIEYMYIDVWRNLYYPLIWSAIILAIYPFVALGPYALWERVGAWKSSLKQKYDSTVALSIPQSIALRKEMLSKERSSALRWRRKTSG